MIGKTALAVTLVATAFIAGCNNDDNPGRSASLSVGHAAALGDAFTPTSATGGFILATPTDGDQGAGSTNEKSGVWFLNPTGPAAGLTLATLPAGWNYEGWIVVNGTPFSTGTFLSPSGADANAGSPLYSPAGGPPFPGEDLLTGAPTGSTFPVDLTTAGTGGGATVVISIEPSPDDSAMPFTLKPLVKQVPTGTAVGAVVPMDNMASTLPTGTATLAGTTLRLTFAGLEPLQNGYYYEGWAIIAGAPVTTGHFNVDSNGQLITHPGGAVIPNGDFIGIASLESATAIVVTVEPVGDADPAPSATHILAGSVV